MKFKLDYRRRLTDLIYTVLNKSLLHILSLTKCILFLMCANFWRLVLDTKREKVSHENMNIICSLKELQGFTNLLGSNIQNVKCTVNQV